MPFQFQRLEIPEVILVTAQSFADDRGFFAEFYKRSAFVQAGIPEAFVQDNHSRSVHGVLRGLHFQNEPKAQGKLVSVARGRVFDVAVDLRRGSPTYAAWVAAGLSSGNGQMLYVPPGFAHGVCVLSRKADLIYKVTAEYAPELDRGIVWDDPDIGVKWPISKPILSTKDAGLPSLQDSDHNFQYG
jgi:dTDP-4-dehydrorhamnose 3,5-epimerase